MTNEKFNEIAHEQISRCENTLCKKSDEYSANNDKLHNFKQAANLQRCKPTTALAGMMVKHTISIYDMLRGLEDGKTYPIELWDEKIGDHINYLLLLSAMLREDPEKMEFPRDKVLSDEFISLIMSRFGAQE